MYHDSTASRPKIWINTLSNHFRLNRQCDNCPCACPEPVSIDTSRSRIERFLRDLNHGAIQDVSLNTQLFRRVVEEYNVLVNATDEPVVVLDKQASELISALRVSCSLVELRTQFSNWSSEVFGQTIAVLLAGGILTPPSRGVQQSVVLQAEVKTLSVWLHLTHRCNLSCQYCYVPKNDQQMDTTIAIDSVKAVYRSAVANDCQRVWLKYAGGEPTLNFNALRAAQEWAERLSAETGIGLETVVLTNGTLLTDDFLEFLIAHGIQVMVSLDGIGQYQDMQRPLDSQEGSSFKLVKDNLDRLIKWGISPHISVTITGKSLEGLSDLVAFLLDRELQFSFNFYREPDRDTTAKDLSFTSTQIINGLGNAFDLIERKLPKYSLLSNLTDRADLGIPHLHPCGVGHNYLVIDSNGAISKCQMDMTHPVTTIAASNPLALVQTDSNGIQNLAVSEKECRECFWRYRCAGGCPRLTFQRAGRYNAKSPICEVYRAILPEVVRLEALRMIRYEEPWNFTTCRATLR